ncbi:hypothetical protein [Desulfovibrio cuneatus]|uniref:hypothetical protein n=1 Tax=Desulfovibrio cuneatus TaxID=159728 RepID=UPI0004834E3E|nr:hypothetical protein [Desulfovibrio cuneatus]
MSSQKRNILIAVVILLVAGGVFLGKPMLDKQLLNEFKEATAKLPGTLTYATAEADAIAKRITLTGVKFIPNGANDQQITADTVVVEAGDLTAITRPGTQRILSMAEAQNLAWTLKDPQTQLPMQGGYAVISVTDVHADVQAFIAATNAPTPQNEQEMIKILDTLQKPLQELRIGTMQGKGYTNKISTPFVAINMTVDSFSATNAGLLSADKGSLQNMVLDAGPIGKFSIQSIEMQDMAMPNLFAILALGENATEQDMMNELNKNPFKFSNFAIKGVSLFMPMVSKEPITAAGWTMKANLRASNGTFDLTQSNLVLPGELVAHLVPGFKQLHGMPLDISASVGVDYNTDDAAKTVALTLRNAQVQEPNLGTATLSAAITSPSAMLQEEALAALDGSKLHSLTMSFENKGIVDLASKVIATQMVGLAAPEVLEATAKALREDTAQDLNRVKPGTSEAVTAMATNLSRAILEQGRFEMKFAPKTPIAPAAFGEVTEGLESSFTPAAK